MSCQTSTDCCGIKTDHVQDCIQSPWFITNSTAVVIYISNQIVSASGTIEIRSHTPDLTQVTVTFSIGATPIMNFTLTAVEESKSFTVIGFDTVTLQGNAISSSESAAGNWCITPRFDVF